MNNKTVAISPAKRKKKKPAEARPLAKGSRDTTEVVLKSTGSPMLSEDGIAYAFSSHHANDLRYTALWGRWSVWDGVLWRRDDTNNVLHLARKVCRYVSSHCDKEHLAIRIASAPTVANVERLARADRRHAATVDQWDRDPWLLNTPAGTVDLHTGTLRPAVREDYCTKMAAVGPGGSCNLWLKFLDRITGGNIELQRYLQRMCGYSLTGSTAEHALFFAYGTGANGKSVFINTITGLMGDYAKTAPMETFIASNSDRHPTDLAGLQGARLVSAIETEEGRAWAESKLKTLTGGDEIAARFMRQDFFEYSPQFKLLIAGNSKPALRTVDEAMRRRFNLVPFTVTIPKPERDPQLTEKLRGEWGGILAWAIEGCLAWQKEKLSPPELVTEATNDYFASEDSMGRWLEECCELGGDGCTSTKALHESWKVWCDANGEQAGSMKRFSQNLESRGLRRYRQADERGFRGITMKIKEG